MPKGANRLASLLLAASGLGGCAQQEFLSDQPGYPCARQVRDYRACVDAFANSLRIRDVQIGQTPSQVLHAMGREPAAKEGTAEMESWLYHTDYAKYLWTRIVFKQGKVAEKPFASRRLGERETAETDSPTARRLTELNLLFDRKLITKDEYEERRKAILRGL